MSAGASLGASLMVTLANPAAWALGLVAFLLRGGLLVVVAPIIVIPSVLGVANVVAPALTSFVFSGTSTELVVLALLWVGGLLVWLIAGGLLAALMELALIRTVAADDDVAFELPDAGGSVTSQVARILTVRMIAHLPLVLALSFGLTSIVAVAYRELTLPADVVTPVVIRIIRGAPLAMTLILVAWIVGEVVGGLAVRGLVMRQRSMVRSLGWAVWTLVRRPLTAVILTIAPLVGLLLVVIPSTMAAGATWTAVRAALASGAGPLVSTTLVFVFVGLWIGGLALLGAVAAWRSAVWTVDTARTFGGPMPSERGTDNGPVALAP